MKPLREMVLTMISMHQQGMHVTREMVYSLIQSCIKEKDVDAAKFFLTTFMLKYNINLVSSIGDIFIRFFASCGCLFEANRVFEIISSPSVHTWHAIMYAHSLNRQRKVAIDLYNKMLGRRETIPNTYIFSCILKACSGMHDLHQGALVYTDVIKMGLESDVVVGSAIIHMYSKCKRMEDASSIFEKSQGQNVVSWNTMMTGFIDQEMYLSAIRLFEKMIKDGVNPDKATFLCAIKAYGNQSSTLDAKVFCELLAQSQFTSNNAIGNALIDMYAKCGDLEKACGVFRSLGSRDIISWSTMISGYVRNGHGVAALELFEKMQEEEGIRPDKISILYVLKACSIIRACGLCRLVHDQLIRNGLVFDLMVGNTLIDTYSKCGDIEQAERTFGALSDRTVVSWNAMLSAYTQHGFDLPALELFNMMQEEAIEPSIATFSCITKACGNLRDLKLGQIIHDQIVKDQLEMDEVVGNTLIDMYTKCGCLDDARKVFTDLPNRNVVSWAAIITGYLEHEDDIISSLILFQLMQEENVEPDLVITLSILKSCGSIGALNWGRLLHDHVIRNGLEFDFGVGNTLIDMYAKCGSLKEAEAMFDRLLSRNVVSWNAMIAGYAQHGYGKLALHWFDTMQVQCIAPTHYTFISLLAACSHSGQVDEGYRYFRSMSNSYNITPGDEHFNCMVDLLGHAGCLNEAEELLNSMPFLPDINGWMSLLTSCSLFGNKELGRRCLGEVVRLSPDTSAGHVLMFNIYADSQIWEEDAHKGFKKQLACE